MSSGIKEVRKQTTWFIQEKRVLGRGREGTVKYRKPGMGVLCMSEEQPGSQCMVRANFCKGR